jgi:hypothetical protein
MMIRRPAIQVLLGLSLSWAVGAQARPHWPLEQNINPAQEPLSKVELQWSLCEDDESAIFAKLGSPAGRPRLRDVYYSETPGLDLFRSGGILRTRIDDSKSKTAAKVKFRERAQVPEELLNDKATKCEWNAYPGVEEIDCSLSHKYHDRNPMISHEQELFLAQITGFSSFSDLQNWGPAKSQEWEWHEPQIEVDLTLESLRLDAQFLSLEISTRVPLAQKQVVFDKIHEWLKRNKINLCPAQKGKTEALLKALIGKVP